MLVKVIAKGYDIGTATQVDPISLKQDCYLDYKPNQNGLRLYTGLKAEPINYK